MAQLSKDFNFKKQFGQNFIFDKNFLLSLVKSFNLEENVNVLEIGAGAGTLTEVLAQNFKNVLSVEIDKTLKEHLEDLSKNYKNLSFIFDDVLKVSSTFFDEYFNNEKFCLIANLPYYITTQIIFKFLFETTNLSQMFVMVQKEVGERFCAKDSTKDYGIPTVLINTFGSAKIVKNVPRTLFMPVPNVDSCILNIKIDKSKFGIKNIKNYTNFISNCFKMKRKTLYNNLSSSGISKEKVKEAINKLNLTESVRPENLTAQNYFDLYNLINEL